EERHHRATWIRAVAPAALGRDDSRVWDDGRVSMTGLLPGGSGFVNRLGQALGLCVLLDDEMIGTTPALFVESWYAFHQSQVDQFFHMFCDVAVRLAAHLGESRGRHWPFEGLQQVDQRE